MRNNKGFDFELGQTSCATQASFDGVAVGVVCDTKLLLHMRLRSFVFLVVGVVLFSYRLPLSTLQTHAA
jgi:hypothetical protein